MTREACSSLNIGSTGGSLVVLFYWEQPPLCRDLTKVLQLVGAGLSLSPMPVTPSLILSCVLNCPLRPGGLLPSSASPLRFIPHCQRYMSVKRECASGSKQGNSSCHKSHRHKHNSHMWTQTELELPSLVFSAVYVMLSIINCTNKQKIEETNLMKTSFKYVKFST